MGDTRVEHQDHNWLEPFVVVGTEEHIAEAIVDTEVVEHIVEELVGIEVDAALVPEDCIVVGLVLP